MIRPLAREDLDTAAALAAAAFRDAPGFEFIVPDAAKRRLRLPSLFKASLSIDLRAGARVMGAYDGDALVGLSSLYPAGARKPRLLAWLRHTAPLAWLYVDLAALARGALLDRAVTRLRPKDRAYLHLLAVHPACEGRGIGGALLKDALCAGPLYLETFEPRNRTWYAERGLKESSEARPSGGVPPFWTFRS